MSYNIDRNQSNIFKQYFSGIKGDTHAFRKALLPLLNENWSTNSPRIIAEIQLFSNKLDTDVYHGCITATHNYINSRDFAAPGRYETTLYLFDAFQYVSETAALKNLNQHLDDLIRDIPQKNTSWPENCANLWSKTTSALVSMLDFAVSNPWSTMTALLYGQAALASTFPAVFNLTSVNGTNGFKINGESIHDQLGYSVSFAGDINGDGYADLVIGAPYYDSESGIGASYVVFGKSEAWNDVLELSALDGNNGFKIIGEADGDNAGYAVSFAGDVNGDGYDDLIIGAPYASHDSGSQAGSSYVIFGKNESWVTPFTLASLNGNNGFRIDGEKSNDKNGLSVSSAGDVNGDNIGDLIVSSYLADYDNTFDAGASYVIFGKNDTWTTPFNLTALNGINGFKIIGETELDFSGYSVDSAGDINGDGFTDLIIGTPYYISGDSRGASYVIFGKPDGWVSALNLSTLDGNNGFKIIGEADGDFSGYSVSSAGDINGDGYDDLITGAIYAEVNSTAAVGISYLIFGNDAEWSNLLELSSINGTNGFKIYGELYANGRSGYSVNSAGDINGDGYDDLIIGAPYASVGGKNNVGSSYVIFGKDNGWGDSLKLSDLDGINGFKINGDAENGYSGISVNLAGDANGDGYGDIIIGAHRPYDGTGSGYVIFGHKVLPLVTLSVDTVSYTENDPALIIDPNIDVQSLFSVIFNATVAVTNNFNAEQDVLTFVSSGNIDGFYNNATGALTLTGTANITDYQNVLRSIRYENLSDDPNPASRDIDFIVVTTQGTSAPVTCQVNITSVNDAPILNNQGGSFDYTEKDSATIIDPSITISDVDNTNLTNATIAITNNFYTEQDVLVFNTQNEIAGIYNNVTGILALTGVTNLTDYQTALRSVRYENVVSNPNTDLRTITFIVNDGIVDSNAATRQINIIPVNDAPVLTNQGGVLNYTENNPPIAIDSSITITDVDDDNLTNATIAIINNFQPMQDMLFLNDSSGLISEVYYMSLGILKLTGIAHKDDYQQALRNVCFENHAEEPNTNVRTVAFTVSDGVGNSNTVTRQINLIAFNDAPVLTTSLNDAPPYNYTENEPAAIIDPTITISDVDNVNLTNATVAINEHFYYLEDILMFVNQNGINGVYNNATGILTLSGTENITNYQDALRSVKYENLSEDPHEGTRNITFIINDGIANSNPVVRYINVQKENDAPILTNLGGAFDYIENSPLAAIDSSITISDPDSINLVSATISITNNFNYSQDILGFTKQNGITGVYSYDTGVLTLTGSSSIAHYQTALRNVTYENLSDNPMIDIRTVTFVVNDGAEISNAVTRDISITAVNDAPTVSSRSKFGNEDTIVTFSVTDFTDYFSDPEGDDLIKIQITSLPNHGNFKLFETAIIADQEILNANLGNITFMPDPHWYGTTEFGWRGYDGAIYSANNATVMLIIEEVNDAPIVTNLTKFGVEDNSISFVATNFIDHFSDLEGNSLVKIRIVSLPNNYTGTLKLLETTVNVDQEIVTGSLGNLKFEPVADWNGVTYFSWKGSDGAAYSMNSANVTLSITAVNDPPYLINNRLTITEGNSVILSSNELSAGDVDNNLDDLTFIISAPQHGQMQSANSHEIVTRFMQYNVTHGNIQFVHDGSNEAPQYFVTVSDGIASTNAAPADISFTTVNDCPMLVHNELSISQGQTLYITANHLSATDEETPAADLQFVISAMQHGLFENINTPDVPITMFLQQKIVDGDIRFSHDGSEYAPTYNVSVSDGDRFSLPSPAIVNFVTTGTTAKDGGGDDDLKDEIIGAAISGVIGLFFLGLKIYLNRKAEQSFKDLTEESTQGALKKQLEFQRNVIRPIAKAIFDRINIKGCLGYIDNSTMKSYLYAVMQIINQLDQNGIDLDFEHMNAVDQTILINEVAKQTRKQFLPDYGCCSCGNAFHFFTSFCMTDASPQEIEDKAETIAIAVHAVLQRRRASALKTVQVNSHGEGIPYNQNRTYGQQNIPYNQNIPYGQRSSIEMQNIKYGRKQYGEILDTRTQIKPF